MLAQEQDLSPGKASPLQSPEPLMERKGPSKPLTALDPQINGVPGQEAVTQQGSKARSVGHVHSGLGVLQTPAETCRKQFLTML